MSTKAKVLLCEMTKEVAPGYEFRLSLVENSSSSTNDIFIHANSLEEFEQKIVSQTASWAKKYMLTFKNGERVKKSSKKVTDSDCKKINKNAFGWIKKIILKKVTPALVNS